MLKNETLEVDGTKWLVREAVSRAEADHAIAMARCSGSVGSKQREIREGVETVLADVVRLNADGTECQPRREEGDDWMERLKLFMSRDLTQAEITRAAELRGDGRPLTLIAQELTATTLVSEPITTPPHIMRRLRQRLDLDPKDTSRDAELNALPPMVKLRHVAAWELGDDRWADEFVTWAKDCGIKITDPRA